MSWESSVQYYRIINERVRQRLGGLHSARCLMWSFDFAEVEAFQHAGRWADATVLLSTTAFTPLGIEGLKELMPLHGQQTDEG